MQGTKCLNCKSLFNKDKNFNFKCLLHPGMSFFNNSTYSYRWTCCNKNGVDVGCTKSLHISKSEVESCSFEYGIKVVDIQDINKNEVDNFLKDMNETSFVVISDKDIDPNQKNNVLKLDVLVQKKIVHINKTDITYRDKLENLLPLKDPSIAKCRLDLYNAKTLLEDKNACFSVNEEFLFSKKKLDEIIRGRYMFIIICISEDYSVKLIPPDQ